MFSKSAIHNLAQALLKRASANEVDWSQDGAKYLVELPAFLLGLSRIGEDSQPDIIFEVDTPEGERVGVVQVKAGESAYPDLRRLLDLAESSTSDWDRRLIDVAKAIEQGSGRIGGVVSDLPHAPSTSPPAPQRPTQEQAEKFFAKIAGKWDLKFEKRSGSYGTETLEIDHSGNYFTFTLMRGNDVARTAFPKFRLLLVSCDEDLEHVEISKQEPNGKHRQIEVLTISANEMRGYAKHDEHELLYTKR